MNMEGSGVQPSPDRENLASEWSNYFRGSCASSLIAPVKGEWRINNTKLADSPGYESMTDTQWLMVSNHKNLNKMLPLAIKQVDVRWQTLDPENQVLLVGPLESPTVAREHIIATDLPDEEAYYIDFRVHSRTNEPVSRGSNCLTVRIFCPKPKAIKFLDAVKTQPQLYTAVLNEMYPGIQDPEITYPSSKLTVISKDEGHIVKQDYDLMGIN